MKLPKSLRRILEWSRRDHTEAYQPSRGDLDSERGLSREHILWAYRLLLDREAGPLDDVDGKLAVARSTADLRASFLASPEYARGNPDGAGFVPSRGVAIAELPGDLRLFVNLADRMIGINILLGNYELGEVAFARSCISAGDHVIDIGANIGYFSVLMASWVGPAGSVAAFEPVPGNLDLLRRSIAENDFEARVRVFPAVVAEASGETDLMSLDVRYAFNSGGSYIARAAAPTPREHQRLRVSKIRIDELDLARPIAFVKIDAEGAEGLALAGARDLLVRDRPTVLAELNPHQLREVSGTSAEKLIRWMADLGFECHQLEGGRLSGQIHSTESLINVVFRPLRP